MSHTSKQASTLGQATAVGAGGGAAVAALATLFSEKPSLKKAVRNILIGGAGGAAIGGGAHALGDAADTPKVAPSASAPPASTAKDTSPGSAKDTKGSMSLPMAAMSGLVPGVGPAIHGGLTEGAGQALASGAASVVGPAVVMDGQLRKIDAAAELGIRRGVSGKATALSALLGVLGATGAAAVGNKFRE